MNQETHEQTIRAQFPFSSIREDYNKNPDQTGRFEILFIHEGKANGFTFSRQVLQDSAPLWESASVFVDHSFWGMPSVRDLGGVLSNAAWSEEFSGLTAELTLAGPSKEIIREAAEITMRDGLSPNIGFSADVVFTSDAFGNVTRILQPYSVDLVVDPAFATKFIRTLNQRRAAPSPQSPWIAEQSEVIRGDASQRLRRGTQGGHQHHNERSPMQNQNPAASRASFKRVADPR